VPWLFALKEVFWMSQNLAMGLWKFHERVEYKSLMEIAEKWVEEEKYKLIYIRKVSKDQNGIGFAYETDGSKEDEERYFDETSDFLKRNFGNDLVGWDIGYRPTIIKGL
jgi:hypothetical protein